MSHPEIDKITEAVRMANGVTAQVSATAQRSAEYGEVKCSVTVTITCPQETSWVDYAAKSAFKAALDYCNDGFSWMAPGVPRIEGPQ